MPSAYVVNSVTLDFGYICKQCCMVFLQVPKFATERKLNNKEYPISYFVHFWNLYLDTAKKIRDSSLFFSTKPKPDMRLFVAFCVFTRF